MPETSPSSVTVRAYLRAVAQLLRNVPHLNANAQRLLADLVDELGAALEADAVPSDEVAHLADCSAQLVTAAQQGEGGMLGRARTRLERAVLAAETEAPLAAGIARRLTETL